MPQRNLLLLLLAIVASYGCYVRCEHDPYCRDAASGLAAIRRAALEPAPSPELFAGAMAGMVGVLRQRGDQHSQFLSAAQADPLRNEIHQQHGGIGIRIGWAGEPRLLVVAGPVARGSPAAKAGLQIGDRILQIDDQPTSGLSRRDMLTRLTGEVGAPVRLTIQGADESRPRAVELVRAMIHIDSILGDRRGTDGNWQFSLPASPRIAQLRIVAFGDRTAAEFAALMPQLVEQGVQGIVLDVRDNAGGSLDSAVAICEMLLPAGKLIVETRGRGQALHERYATSTDGQYRDVPLAVIINHNSASAAEVVAACLQDHGRAVVIGQRSFGKGTVQQLLPLGKGLLKLTLASLWRPSGARVDRLPNAAADAVWGVWPDSGFECEWTPRQYAAFQDYRNLRDENEIANGDGDNGLELRRARAATFVDQPVVLARRYLESRLNEKTAGPITY